MTTPRRRVTAGEAATMAGHAMGMAIRGERKRNRWHFAALWVAVAITFIAAVLS